MISNKNVGECSPIFSCKKCHYNTVKKFNYDKHVLTAKHQKSIGINENVGECSKSSKFLHKCKNCEKISQQLQTVKTVSNITASVSFIIIAIFLGLIILNDFSRFVSFLLNRSKPIKKIIKKKKAYCKSKK